MEHKTLIAQAYLNDGIHFLKYCQYAIKEGYEKDYESAMLNLKKAESILNEINEDKTNETN